MYVPWHDIARLTALRELSLAGNQLTGELSESLCGMVSLRSVALQHNEFDGFIPECLTNLTDLQLLWCVLFRHQSCPRSRFVDTSHRSLLTRDLRQAERQYVEGPSARGLYSWPIYSEHP